MFFKRKNQKIISVEGMTCKHCTQKLENALENLIDISNAKANLNKKTITITYESTVDEILIKKTIEDLGYTVTGIKE